MTIIQSVVGHIASEIQSLEGDFVDFLLNFLEKCLCFLEYDLVFYLFL